MTSSARGSSVERSTSLPNVDACADHRQKRAVADLDPPLRFYSGSLRHKDSILLRKSKLRQVQLRPSGERRAGDSLKTKNVAAQVIRASCDETNGDYSDCRSQLSPRPGLSPNGGESEVRPGHTRVIASWEGGAWLPELRGRNCREPTWSELRSRRHCSGNNVSGFRRNSTDKLTVILSAVDLPSVPRAPFHCEFQTASIDIRCPPDIGSRCHGVATARYLVEPQSIDDGRLRIRPAGTRSINAELGDEKSHPDAALTSSSLSPELIPQHENSSVGGDGPMSGRGSQLSGAPVLVTSQRRVYQLARAYSDRVKQLQRRSTYHADDLIATELRVPVHRAVRARSASVGRSTALPLSTALFYR